jgi:DNA repair exonuclease SbcCD ATPase subunit
MELEDLQKRCNEHQRQLTQLFELYERTKIHNDNRAFMLHQSLSTLQSQLEGLSREARNTSRSFEHLQMALRSFGYNDILKQYKTLEKSIQNLEARQVETYEIVQQQSQRTQELERIIRHTFILDYQSNTSLIEHDRCQMREIGLDNMDHEQVFELDTSMFSTPQFMPCAPPENVEISPMVLPKPACEQ